MDHNIKRERTDFIPVSGSDAPDSNQYVTYETGKNEMTPELARKAIIGIEAMMLNAPAEQQVGLETQHNFTDSVYCRTVLMHAGQMIVGKIHKLEHTVIISKGSASVLSEEFGTKHLQAPMVFVSPPGVKRLLFIHDDMIWTTVHKNLSNTRDISVLESELIAADYSELEGVK